MVHDFDVTTPRPGVRLNLNPNPQQGVSKFEWNNDKHGRIYDIYYTMSYKEGRIEDPVEAWKRDMMVWHVGSYSASKTGSGEVQPETFRFNSAIFYEQVQENIAYNEDLRRRPYVQAKITIRAGSEELYHYHHLNESSHPSPDLPEYTNMKTKLN